MKGAIQRLCNVACALGLLGVGLYLHLSGLIRHDDALIYDRRVIGSVAICVWLDCIQTISHYCLVLAWLDCYVGFTGRIGFDMAMVQNKRNRQHL